MGMVNNTELKTMVQNKKSNEKWHCIMCPDGFAYWNLKDKWVDDKFEKFNVKPRLIYVSGVNSKTQNSGTKSISKKKPIMVRKHVPVWGSVSDITNQSFHYKFEPDSTIQINNVLTELATRKGVFIDQFRIDYMEVYQPGKPILRVQNHNPDNTGSALYIVGFRNNDMNKLYPNVSIGTQIEWIGKFKGFKFAHCTPKPTYETECALKQKEHLDKLQIKLNKKSESKLRKKVN